ncbi:PREDICTED: protein ZGRF1 [Chaetura pelagica]|uniref:protein ZGRF1 n=1 Tax=Chaetura pelagica TaxID=8897 RepID=UPI00052371A1|nr:PREDICTED: protein ZGRF1 [Chaetura pelagica]
MASQEFTVLYTHQKMKKSKTWQDGILRIGTGRNKAVLFDDKGQCLESVFIKSQVNAGDYLESERYLITVEAVKVNEASCEDQLGKAGTPAAERNGVKPGVLPPRHLSVGLKRKFRGFQGPRQVEKKIPAVEYGEKAPILPVSEQCQGTFPSKFYVTSPLFSTVGRKDAATNLSADSQGGACVDDDGEHRSVSSLLSAQFLDRCQATEKPNSPWSTVKPESLIAGDAQPGGYQAVSRNIRSTAQIIALLKAKPAPSCREQAMSDITECHSSSQASEYAESSPHNQSSTILPAFSGNPAEKLVQNTQHLPSMEQTVSDKKEWNPEMLLNSAEQPCEEEVTWGRDDKKANHLSQDLQDPSNTNNCCLAESTINRLSDSQFLPSSGDILPLASPVSFEKTISRDREQSVTNGLKENSSLVLQRELQPRQNSEGAPSDPELSVDMTVTKTGVAKEGLSTSGQDCGPDEPVMEVNFNLMAAFDFDEADNPNLCERDVNKLTEGDVLSQSPDCLKEEDAAQDAALRLRSCYEMVTDCKNEEVKCSAFDTENDGNHFTRRITEFCDNKLRGTGRIGGDLANQSRMEVELLGDGHKVKEMNESQLSNEATNNKKDLDGCAAHMIIGMSDLPGDMNVNDCHPKASMFEETGTISCVSASTVVSAMDRRTEEDVTELGCIKCPDADLEHFWSAKSDIKPGSPLLDLSQKSESSCGSFQYIGDDHQKEFVISSKEGTLISRSSVHPLGKGHQFPEETVIGETEFENGESINAFGEACKGERIGMECLKSRTVAENVSDLPDEIKNLALLRALTQHSTALESLQKMKENDSIFSGADTPKKIFEPVVQDEAIKQFTEMPYSESIQASSCSYFDSPGLMPVAFQGHQVKGSAASEMMWRAPSSQLGWQQYPDNTEFAAQGLPSPLFSSSYVLSDFRQSPDSRSLHEDDTNFVREDFQNQFSITREARIDQSCQEKSSYPEECNLSRCKAPVRPRTPFVTLPDAVCPPDNKEVQQSFSSSVVHLGNKSVNIRISELSFPNVDKVKHAALPQRKVSIPTVFQSHVHYKQVFTAALTEQLNIMLFELSQRLHNALSKVDISFYTALKDGQSESKASSGPLCNHRHPAKLVMVKKEGQNKGRLFYACDAPKAEQCSFFKWIEDVNPTQLKSRPSAVLHDVKSIGTYLRSQKISLYEECQLLVRKAFEMQTQRCSKFRKFMNTPASFDGDSKSKLYLKLSRKEHYSLYSKDDIWVVSKTLNFDPLDTFIASSAFFGPSSNNEVELLPLKGYSPSNWPSNMCVHALLVCNASSELTSLRNLEDHFTPATLPLIPYLLKMNFDSENATKRVSKRKFMPPAISLKQTMVSGPVSTEVAMGLAEKMIQTFSLNPDQATSLIQIAQMMTSCENTKPVEEHHIFPITIICGVFGAGKSYLLSIVILFLVQLFESSEATEGPRPTPWKLLIASSTNVAVDRILLGLLDLGFEDFIRVGSIRKITKAILPHSLHAGSGNENEQLKELLALMKEDLTPAEKMYVRKSIEQHKLGTNKTILQQVKVVGATCAACPFPCLNALKFPVVMLDECSQMTEPASLLPIARFQCEKLVLVGDPKQLPPTIQGSESVHEKGLEQTLFDRLCLMGHKAILLRTQYRCHPAISSIANELFYEGNLIDGVSEEDRSPLLDWLPTLCFYSVNGVEQIERDNSFYNMAEVHFTVKLIQSLIASGIESSAIGVITLYKSQMCKVCNLLSSVHSEAFDTKALQVSTVDAFQGAEKEIIVLSCVRTRQIGFIDSEKRVNVALTRAKRHLLIVGNLPCLSRNRLWGRVIHHCKGWENGLQHVSQCEQQLNDILNCYLEKWKEEEENEKKEK